MRALDRIIRNVNTLLKERGWKPAELARRSPVSKAYVYMILNGTYEPSINKCEELASGFGMTFEQLLTYDRRPVEGSAELHDLYAAADSKGRQTILSVASAVASRQSK